MDLSAGNIYYGVIFTVVLPNIICKCCIIVEIFAIYFRSELNVRVVFNHDVNAKLPPPPPPLSQSIQALEVTDGLGPDGWTNLTGNATSLGESISAECDINDKVDFYQVLPQFPLFNSFTLSFVLPPLPYIQWPIS